MVQRKRKAAKRPARRTLKSTTTKAKSRAKKGVKRAVRAMQVTPAQKKRLHQRMREFERHINTMTKKYNQILNVITHW